MTKNTEEGNKSIMNKYDKDIQEIKEEVAKGENFRDVVNYHWVNQSPLFSFMGVGLVFDDNKGQCAGGCLTMIKGQTTKAVITPNGYVDHDMTERIYNDDHVPTDPDDIKSFEDLEIFKKYQMMYDEKYGEDSRKAWEVKAVVIGN